MGSNLVGLENVMASLNKRLQKIAKNPKASVIVGYDASYALRIHEDLEMFHSNGQAKFLEIPLRQHSKDMLEFIKRGLKEGRPLQDVLQAAGVLLLEESKQLVPVRTGALRDSGFVQVET